MMAIPLVLWDDVPLDQRADGRYYQGYAPTTHRGCAAAVRWPDGKGWHRCASNALQIGFCRRHAENLKLIQPIVRRNPYPLCPCCEKETGYGWTHCPFSGQALPRPASLHDRPHKGFNGHTLRDLGAMRSQGKTWKEIAHEWEMRPRAGAEDLKSAAYGLWHRVVPNGEPPTPAVPGYLGPEWDTWRSALWTALDDWLASIGEPCQQPES